MTFGQIMQKNFKYNIRKYASFFIVNAFVVCVLFLFGSLLFNDILNEDAAIQAAQSMIVMAAVGITLFSIIFLTYTGVYFIRSRGREFGVYLTLGMTSQNLSKMVGMESAVIFTAAAVLGIAGALMLGHLFYLALARVLGVGGSLFFINYRTFLYSIGLLVTIFLVQYRMASRFIRKLSIVEIMKSAKTKGLATKQAVAGLVSTAAFIISLIVLHAIATGAGWVAGYTRLFGVMAQTPPMAVMIISMFFMIGSGVACVAVLCKKFPAMYYRNILLLTGLTHKFKSYRASLFSVTLLVTFAVFFIGIAMSFFIYGRLTIDVFQPHDFMVEQRGEINAVSEADIIAIVAKAGGETANILSLPYIDSTVYRNHDGSFTPFRQNSFLVSQSYFNRFMGENISLASHELLIVTNQVEAYHSGVNFSTRIEPFSLEFAQENTTVLHIPFVNSHGAMEFTRSHANVVADEVFAQLVTTQTNAIIAFDLASGCHTAVMDALLRDLSMLNNLPYSIWQTTAEFDLANRDNPATLRPISRAEREDILVRANSFLLFVMAFLGFLFMAAASIVLYCKFTADTDEEKDHVTQLKRIGLTLRECKRYLSSHIAIVFYLPLFLGGVLGLSLTYSFVSAVDEAWFLTSRVAIMYSFVVVFGTLVYGTLRRKFFKDVLV